MLRPSRAGRAAPRRCSTRDDGSVAVALAVNHAAPNGDGWTRFGPSDDDAPEPDPPRSGPAPPHTIELRLVREDGAWKLDTDLLALLEQRLGTVDELVGPLSGQRD